MKNYISKNFTSIAFYSVMTAGFLYFVIGMYSDLCMIRDHSLCSESEKTSIKDTIEDTSEPSTKNPPYIENSEALALSERLI